MDETNAIQQSWQQAASDLGIEVETLGNTVLVANFGRPAGMICALRRTRTVGKSFGAWQRAARQVRLHWGIPSCNTTARCLSRHCAIGAGVATEHRQRGTGTQIPKTSRAVSKASSH
jgi:hypothetical protein